ncbi:MAG TPA: hypothetical protein VF834_01810 [Streptosporangiaceae bacterium]
MTTPTEMSWDPQIVTELDPAPPDGPTPEPASVIMEKTAWGPRIVTDAGQAMPESAISETTTASSAASLHPAAPDASELTPDPDSAAAEAGLASGTDTGPEPDTKAEAASGAAVPGTEGAASSSPVADDASLSLQARWHEILAMFVDDPRSAVELAAGLADDRAEAVVVSIKERQASLLSAWQRHDAGTEELRIALQQYRIIFTRLQDILQGE